MGQGYTRNDTSNNIADGNIINASDLDGEFDAVEAAFNSSTGHTHDGTSAEGGAITVLGPVQDFVASATEIRPKTTNTLDIGTASLQFKDLHLDGTAYLDDVQAAGAVDITGDLDVDNININGNTIISTNTNGNIVLTPNGTGEVDISKVDIDSGTIDGTTIGGTTAAAGTFTNLTADYLAVGTTSDSYSQILINSSTSGESELRMGDTDTDAGSVSYTNSDDTMTFRAAAGARMALNSAGLDVTGTVTANGLTVDGAVDVNGATGFDIQTTNTNPIFERTDTEVKIATRHGGVTTTQYYTDTGGSLSLRVDPTNALANTFFNITVDGSEAMRINSSGNVGIGTTSPLTGLYGTVAHISGTSGGLILSSTSTSTFGIGSVAGVLQFYDSTNASERMRIDSSGRVGIGTTAMGSMNSYGSGFTVGNSGISGSAGMTIYAGANTGYSSLYFGDPDDTKVGWFEYNHNNDSLAIGAGNAEAARITSAGLVGIGTSDPATYGVDNADDLVIGQGDGNHGITISSFNTSNGTLAFSDTTNATVGRGFVDYDHNIDAMSFGTLGTERARLDSSGNLLVGRTSTGLTGNGHSIRGGDSAIFSRDAVGETMSVCRNDSTGDLIRFYRNGTVCGEIVNTGATTVNYNTSSDYRLKENVAAITDGITRVKQLQPKRFNFISEADRTVDGFIAHEAQEVVPEAVTGERDAMREEEYEVTPAVLDEDGNVVTEAVMGTRQVPDYQGIDQSKLVPLLTAALQEAIAKIETLEQRITTLENA